MLIQDTILLAIAAILSLATLALSIVIAGEVVRIVREFLAQAVELRRSASAPSEPTPLPRTRSREVIERMISRMEEGRDTPADTR